MDNLGTFIKMKRLEKGMTQQQLASRLYVTKQAVSKWENNRGTPDLQTIPILADIFDTSNDQLLGRKRKFKYIKQIFLTLTIVLIFLISYPIINKYILMNKISDEFYNLTDITLPTIEKVESYDFVEWEEYGNEIIISKMNYYVFKDNDKLNTFEEMIFIDDRWLNNYDQLVLMNIPNEVLSYYKEGNLVLLINTNNGINNDTTCNINTCVYIILIYQEDNRRLLMFELNLSGEGRD